MNKEDFIQTNPDSTEQLISLKVNNTAYDSVYLNDSFDKEKIREDILNDTTASEDTKKAIIGGINILDHKETFLATFMKKLSNQPPHQLRDTEK